ncbi:erv26 super protein [Actinomortierella ambigua]|uniref:Erv26 super protein n=1 Tax=Actinomortierella ambigua TaxID=1343610 RepID=A0A9P6U748_9FUNG|nr:erv26 super protein [Actinomortierella ambigua]
MAGMAMAFVGYAGSAIAFLFAVLSIACGLYYLAELVEEYTVQTKRVIKGMTVAVVALHVLLWLMDGLPFSKIAFSLVCHGVYSLNLANFPNISLVSLPFLASCVLVLADHFMWFQYFGRHYHTFSSIASFFGICVWLVPFSYFISLSANDNTLPNFDKTSKQQQKKSGIFKTIFGTLLNKKESTPTLVETPKYTGFGNNASMAPTPTASNYHQQHHHHSSSSSISNDYPSSPSYAGYNPTGPTSTTTTATHGYDSRPSSRNQSRSNSPFTSAAAGTGSGVPKGYVANNSSSSSSSYGGSTGNTIYSQHSSSTLSNRF